MKALIYAFGSRGDVQPYLALAHALAEAGHEVVFSASENARRYADEYGIKFTSRDDRIVRLNLEDPVVQQLVLREGDDKKALDKATRKVALGKLREALNGLYPGLLDDMWAGAEAAGDVDIVIHQHNALDHGHHIAEKLNVPSVLAALHPHAVPSGDYGIQITRPEPGRSRLLNKLSHKVVPLLQKKRKEVVRWRRDVLGLPPRKKQHDRLVQADGSPTTVLLGFSEHLVERAVDWPSTVHTTGFWFLPAAVDWTPPTRLARFLDAGAPPVFIGFGSLRKGDPATRGRTVLDAIEKAGVRAIVGTGWGGIEIASPPEHVLVLDEVPYDWLLPRVGATVHAGGTGTVHAALVAGVPQVACPFHIEQAYWAATAYELGVSATPIPQGRLGADNLAAAITEVTTSDAMAKRAAEVAERVRADQGAAAAVKIIEEVHERHAAGVR